MHHLRTFFSLLVLIQAIDFRNLAQDLNQNDPMSGLPLAVIFDKSVPDHTFEIVDSVIKNLNTKAKYRRHKWSIHVSKIDTDNTQILISTICSYMSRGVLAIFGSTNISSFDTVRSLTNKYNIPFLSWSFFSNDPSSLNKKPNEAVIRSKKLTKEEHDSMEIRIENLVSDVKGTEALISKPKRNVNFNPTSKDYEYLYGSEYESKDGFNIGIEYLKNMKRDAGNDEKQLYLQSNLRKALVELIKFYQWNSVYYLYNHEKGFIGFLTLYGLS